ncbi:calcium/sodium antiporter [Halorhodospira halochloris]|uniref:calcium/sodium antiporter n=1 Tax=Halorhodospira halochloris TaxID=1052 RepID=UPI001EE91A10|nr:calcium/sodium antiporter [Halorhodospira halochloris]MCG5529505.1 calcium/sodium antiporter [Halorhodospira halochloris]
MLALTLFFAGLAILLIGADLLVRMASQAAAHWQVPPLVVGLTIVAFGTSAPELAITLRASLTDHAADIAIGNVIGSNIANTFLILGVSAVIAPLIVTRLMAQFHIPAMLVASLLTAAFALSGNIGNLEGGILLTCLTLYLLITILRKDPSIPSEASPTPDSRFSIAKGLLLILSIIVLGVGAYVAIEAAVSLATSIGVSELVIGLTVVAVGTSLPELATSVIATWRGQRQMALANLIGSNILNLLAVLGAAALISPQGISVASEAIYFDIPIMLLAALACFFAASRGMAVTRRAGAIFLVFYGAYCAYLLA